MHRSASADVSSSGTLACITRSSSVALVLPQNIPICMESLQADVSKTHLEEVKEEVLGVLGPLGPPRAARGVHEVQ